MTDGQYYTDQERVYHDGLTSIAQSGRRKVSTGCKVEAQSSPDMTVKIGSGTVYFADTLVGVNETTNLVVPASHATYNRYDIVVINSSGTVSLLSGTPKAENDGYGPVPPSFSPETYLVLARLTVSNGVTSITSSDIKDLRAIGSASGSGGGIGSYNIAVTNSTSTVVTHNLNDPIPDVECWTYNTSPTEIIIPANIQHIDDNSFFAEFDTTSDVRITVQGGVFNNLNVTQARDEVTITNATSNTYTHSFAVKPLVQFVDSDGVIQNSGFTVDHISDNTVYTEFSPQTSGTLILCGGAFGEIKTTKQKQIQKLDYDLTYPPTKTQSNNIITHDFTASSTSGVLFSFVPQFNQSCIEDMDVELSYFMSSTDGSTVNLQMDISMYEDSDTIGSLQTSLIESLTVPAINIVDKKVLSTIKIPAQYLHTSKITTCEFYRKDTDSNAADLKLMNIDLIYKTN